MSRSDGNSWGYSICEPEAYGSDGSNTGTVAQLPLTNASASYEVQPTAYAIDQNDGTRWESQHGVNNAWSAVDLGTAQDLTRVEIGWEAANASDHEVRGSNDGASWTTLSTETGGAFGTRTDLVGVADSYRHLRLNMLNRSEGNQWGYSIFEVRVFGY